MPVILALWGGGRKSQGLKVILSYIESLRSAWAAWHTVSKPNKNIKGRLLESAIYLKKLNFSKLKYRK